MINTITEAKYLARVYLLALCIYREARGEPFYGKLLVANVIKNRVRDSRWPDSYEKVITQPWQFSAFNKNDPNALVFPSTRETPGPEDKAWLDCLDAAQKTLNGEPVPGNHQANHYHAKNVAPRWSEGKTPVAVVGNHKFFLL